MSPVGFGLGVALLFLLPLVVFALRAAGRREWPEPVLRTRIGRLLSLGPAWRATILLGGAAVWAAVAGLFAGMVWAGLRQAGGG